jgi:hypothetical protein
MATLKQQTKQKPLVLSCTITSPESSPIPAMCTVQGTVVPINSNVTATFVDHATGALVASGTTNAVGNRWQIVLTVPAGGTYDLKAYITSMPTIGDEEDNLKAQ